MTENVTMTRAELARMIDDTLLAPEATDDDVTRLAQQAAGWAWALSASRRPGCRSLQGCWPPGSGWRRWSASRRGRTRHR